MNFADRITQGYFNRVYNPVYDFTTARVTPYRMWQESCIDKLRLADGDRILCLGVGTGNEITRIFERNRKVNIVAVDISDKALERASEKAHQCGKSVEIVKMDAANLEFDSESFDAALCVHLMDFLDDHPAATTQLLRVLRAGGRFSITFPLSEGLKLVTGIMRGSLCQNFKSRQYRRAALEIAATLGACIAFLPLTLRSKRTFHSDQQLRKMFDALNPQHFEVERHRGYEDFIVYGTK